MMKCKEVMTNATEIIMKEKADGDVMKMNREKNGELRKGSLEV